MTEELINIRFTKTDGVYTLDDALNLTQGEIDTLGEDGLEALKQQRFDNWVAFITAPVPESDPEITE